MGVGKLEGPISASAKDWFLSLAVPTDDLPDQRFTEWFLSEEAADWKQVFPKIIEFSPFVEEVEGGNYACH
jgi:hypothetical protein